MSVLVEGISVVVRVDTIQQKYPGGFEAYVKDCPNSTLCADKYLARVGFMNPIDVEDFVTKLQGYGFVFVEDGKAVEIVVVDQRRGPMMPVSWIRVGQVSSDETRLTVAADNRDSDPHISVMPLGWKYENSLSQHATFVSSDKVGNRMEQLREVDGVETYRDRVTGSEQYLGRTRRAP